MYSFTFLSVTHRIVLVNIKESPKQVMQLIEASQNLFKNDPRHKSSNKDSRRTHKNLKTIYNFTSLLAIDMAGLM